MPDHRSILLAVTASAALGLAACGSSSSGNSSSSTASATPASTAAAGSGQTVKLAATESGGLSFDHKQLSAKAGSVTLSMDNPGSNATSHGIAIEGKGVDKDGKVVSPGGTSTVTVKLKPGTYTFYCPVPGHEQAGMKGTLTVS